MRHRLADIALAAFDRAAFGRAALGRAALGLAASAAMVRPRTAVRSTRLAARLAASLAGLLAAAVPAGSLSAQLHGQHWDVTPETDRPTVGDTVTLAFRVRLDERDLLFDTVPKPAVTPPDWVRILSVEKLQRQPDRIFIGHAKVAFYRPGKQLVPIFQLPFMRSVKGLERGTFASDSATVEVIPVLTAGSSGTLRDIKEVPSPKRPGPAELIAGLAALAAAGWLAWRARRPQGSPPLAQPASAGPPIVVPDPHGEALRRLDAAVSAGWSSRDVVRFYAEVTDALRDYLEAYGIPARERTTSELRWALPAALAAGRPLRHFSSVFDAADLVKFAHWRPEAAEADSFAAEARALLQRWAQSGALVEEPAPMEARP